MMRGVAEKAAEAIRASKNEHVEIISHMDADGVCAAAVTSRALDRLGIEHHVKFVRMLYKDVVCELDPADLTIFTDLGSSQLQNVRERYFGRRVVIIDHHYHKPIEPWPELVHFNAHDFGVDGMQEISGAGMAYFVARELDERNKDLAGVALIGALGDVQNAWGRLMGPNREIAREAVEAGVIEQSVDLMLYGRHSRPIFKALESFSDPPIPGVSGSPAGCISLLKDLNIPLKAGESWRRPADLSPEEKQRLASELIARAYATVPKEFIKYVPNLIIGETFTLRYERDTSLLKDAEEFSTCLNSTAHHEQPLIGLEVAKGDRGAYYRAMLSLIRHHRRNIAQGLEFIEVVGLSEGPKGYLQYFDGTGEIKETFIGTIASLALGYQHTDPYKPVVGIVRISGIAKISARCSKLLFLRGLNMGEAIRKAAGAVGGEGGGHAVACGAQVDESRIPRFIQEFEERLLEQLAHD